jgi:hypothetical protein
MVDSNVLLDIFTQDPVWRAWSEQAVIECGTRGTIAINQVVFAELAPGYRSIGDLNEALPADTFRREDLPWEASYLAGQAHRIYRSRGGTRRTPLGDFFIGAHAVLRGYTLITRDTARYRTYFPGINLVTP